MASNFHAPMLHRELKGISINKLYFLRGIVSGEPVFVKRDEL